MMSELNIETNCKWLQGMILIDIYPFTQTCRNRKAPIHVQACVYYEALYLTASLEGKYYHRHM